MSDEIPMADGDSREPKLVFYGSTNHLLSLVTIVHTAHHTHRVELEASAQEWLRQLYGMEIRFLDSSE